MAELGGKTTNRLRDLLGLEYEDFVKKLGEFADDEKIVKAIEAGKKDGRLSDEKVIFKTVKIPVKKLHPTQNEIDVDKSLKFQLDGKYPQGISDILKGDGVILKAPIITLNGKYIIDGHHRWSQVYSLNKDATMEALNMEIDEDPIDVLKAVQMAIVATIGEVPTQNVEGHNLLHIKEEKLKKYVEKEVSETTINILHNSGKIADPAPDAVADFMWENIKLMQATSQPVKGAPDRDFMPQTDDAETDKKSWRDLLKAGVINFKEPISANESKHEMRFIKLFESFVNESEGNVKFFVRYEKQVDGEMDNFTEEFDGNEMDKAIRFADEFGAVVAYEKELPGGKTEFGTVDPAKKTMVPYRKANESAGVYHNSYSEAVQFAREQAEKKGYTIDDDEWFRVVNVGPKKPSDGKTNKLSLELLKNGKPSKKMLHMQVYGMGKRYELNYYIQ